MKFTKLFTKQVNDRQHRADQPSDAVFYLTKSETESSTITSKATCSFTYLNQSLDLNKDTPLLLPI